MPKSPTRKKTVSAKAKGLSKKSKAKKPTVAKKKAAAKKTVSRKQKATKRKASSVKASPRSPEATSPNLEISSSRQFAAWMAENRVSLAFTTYQAGKLFLIGLQPDGRLSIFERTFNRCMGLTVHNDTLYMSSLYQLWRFENMLEEGQGYEGYDRVYLPVNGHTTGDLDIHDIGVDAAGRPVFVNSLFSCLATLDPRHSFQPLWQPSFVSRLAAEDRCHLNGLAMADGAPKYVTACAQSDVADGWRDKRVDGGCVIDVPSGSIVADGFSMPHSPRVYQEKLWLLNSGQGEFGELDPVTGRFEPIAFCPGYLRGLAFHRFFAIVGLSKPRSKTFFGLPLEDRMKEKDADSLCAIYVIDLRSGDVVHWLRIDGAIEELYDVVALPGVVRPMAMGFKTDEIRRTISIAEPGTL